MTRLRTLVGEHKAAAAIIVAALAAFAIWKVYALVSAGGPAATPSAVQPATRQAPLGTPSGTGQPGRTGAPGGSPTGDAALRAAGHLAGVPAPRLPGGPSTGAAPTGAPSTGAAGGQPAAGQATRPAGSATAPAASTPPPGTGRADPFSPLAAPAGSGPVSTNPLPPVPPLAPGAGGPSGFPAPGLGAPGAASLTGPRGQFQLTGIVYGPVAVAILSDGAASYIVEPGDTVTPGVRIVAIDAENHSVTLASKDQSWQLRLGGGTSR